MCLPYNHCVPPALPETEREKLERAIERLEKREWCADATVALAAARKHLETLPKTKPMWFVIWQSPAGFHTTGHSSPTGAAEVEANLLINDRLAIATVGPYEVPE